MRTFIIMILVSSVYFTSCQEGNFFGEKFEPGETITIGQLVSQLDESSNANGIVVEGTVEDVCQVKGCWMTMVTDEGSSVRVSFKDYGFFVPKDIHGKKVVMKGNGEIVVTSVDDLKHYAEDEGQSAEQIVAITEAETEYSFVADGVQLLD